MVAATINEKVDEWAHAPYLEVVQLEASNDETYTSTKFKTVLVALATTNGDVGSQATETAVTIGTGANSAVVTLRNSNLSDTDVTLVLFGIK